jgi:MerR family transcriptional regulator, redox-sensitive transcriptional activator SoxR
MTIGDLSAQSGVPASTIRYWERIGVLPRAARVSGQRRYSPDSVHRLALLRLSQACGFRLDEIRELLHGFGPAVQPPGRWQALTRRKREEIDQQLSRLNAMRAVIDRVALCQCADLAECGRLAAAGMGVRR